MVQERSVGWYRDILDGMEELGGLDESALTKLARMLFGAYEAGRAEGAMAGRRQG